MLCVRCSVSFQVVIFVLATKDLDTSIFMVNVQMQINLVAKIMHQNSHIYMVFVLRLNWV